MSDADPSGSTPETAGDLETDSHAAEAGEGAGGAGQEHQEDSDSHEVEVVEGVAVPVYPSSNRRPSTTSRGS